MRPGWGLPSGILLPLEVQGWLVGHRCPMRVCEAHLSQESRAAPGPASSRGEPVTRELVHGERGSLPSPGSPYPGVGSCSGRRRREARRILLPALGGCPCSQFQPGNVLTSQGACPGPLVTLGANVLQISSVRYVILVWIYIFLKVTYMLVN